MSCPTRHDLGYMARLFIGLLSVSVLGTLGCQRGTPNPGNKNDQSGRIRIAPKPASTLVAGRPATSAATPQSEEAERYTRDIRPILLRRGCASGSCHAMARGGGFYFTGNDERELRNVTLRLNRESPEKSELLLKATGATRHNGGRNMAVGSCDYKRLVAWIERKPDIRCSDDVPRDEKRFAREVVPALRALGCGTCHSEPGPAQAKLDLSSLKLTEAFTAQGDVVPAVQSLFLRVSQLPSHTYSPWISPVLQALLAMDGKHEAKFDRRGCAVRRIYGYIADSPELDCDVAVTGPAPGMPDFDQYVKQLYPTITKRGCFDTTCHGGGVPDMPLHGVHETDALGGWHDFFMLTARIEDFSKPEKSTLLTTIRNEQPHGGGQRLGGPGDCVDDATSAWLHKKPIQPCRKPTAVPTYARFVAEVQPVLDKMTCTQNRCHGENIPHFVLKPFAKDAKTLRQNYEWTLRKINLEFMPFSEVMLRMVDACAYSKVAAWIESKPGVTCEIVPPPQSAFPRVDEKPQHEKMKPGAPSAAHKG